MSVNLNLIIGAAEVGLLASTFLFGVATVQTWIYYERFPDDRRFLKATVMSVWLLELAHVICNSHGVYTMAVTDYGQLLELAIVPKSIFATFVLTGVLVFIIQTFYAIRIHSLTERLYIPIFCCATSFAVFVISIIVFVIGLKSANAVQYLLRSKKVASAGLILGATVDTVIAISLCWYFKNRKISAMKRTERALDKLIGWTMQTGLLTSLTAIVVAVVCQTMSDNYVWVGVWMVNSAVIANSFLALLNARTIFRNAVNAPVIPLSSMGKSESSGSTAKYITDQLKFTPMSDTVGQDTVMSQYHKA